MNLILFILFFLYACANKFSSVFLSIVSETCKYVSDFKIDCKTYPMIRKAGEVAVMRTY